MKVKNMFSLEMFNDIIVCNVLTSAGEYLPRYAASPSRSVPTTPKFTDESVADPKHLTKRQFAKRNTIIKSEGCPPVSRIFI
ncbi:hypothetical protein Anas_07196 [Armadillidium nasatum]|uniref:Uncharacterized protein n=1 Tax=Armadillidium nasatum TaxID=96803 RepID=A0A5N5TBX6_9CRUS|nr:hypothetical protein Anas_07196 [Armadillidium nasatum]